MKRATAVLCGLLCAGVVVAAPDADVTKLLKDAGAATYAEKAPYGGGIASAYIGYDTNGVPVVGIATRQTKTYKEALAIVVVKPDGAKFKIDAARIPDVGSFHGKSKTYTEETLRDIEGRVLADEAEARGLVDAVTGATQYKQAIYVSYSLMASRLIQELKANPAWERKPF